MNVKKLLLIITAFSLIIPAILIYFGYFHLLLIVSLAFGIAYNLKRDTFLSTNLKNPFLKNLNLVLTFFLGFFTYQASKNILDLELILRSLFEYWPFTLCYITLTVTSIFSGIKRIQTIELIISET